MGFGAFGNQGATLRPTVVGRNRARSQSISVPAYETETPNVFGIAHQMFVAGESFPRVAINPGVVLGGAGGAAPAAALAYSAPPSGSAAGAVGTWAHNGVRPGDLGWRNVKHWGAAGDNATDDKAAIQACISAGSGTVYLPPGTYIIQSGLSIPSNIRLVGAGAAVTTIKGGTSFVRNTGAMLQSQGLTGTFSTSGSVSNVTMEHFAIDGNAINRPNAVGPGSHLIWFRAPVTSPSTNLAFRHLRLFNAPAMALAIQCANYVDVSHNRINDCGRDGISFWGTVVWARVANNVCENLGDDGVAFNASATNDSDQEILVEQRDNTVTGNTFGPSVPPSWSTGNGGDGVALNGCSRTAVVGNTIHSQVAGGIRLSGWKTLTQTEQIDIAIVGNTIEFTDHGGFGVGGHDGNGITVNSGTVTGFGGAGATYPNIRRVVIANNTIWNPRGHGVWIVTSTGGGFIEDVIVEGNVIEGNSGSGTDAQSVGVLVGGATGTQFNSPRSQHFVSAVTAMRDIVVQGNTIEKFAYYGVRMHGITRPTVQHNRVVQNGVTTTAPGISLASPTDAYVHGNRSRNLSGSGQTYGIEFVSTAGTAVCNGNMVSGNSNAAGILNTTPGGTFYVWDNPGSTVTRNAPPN